MALTLIGDDQPITAALWNTLFQELDTKVATVLDNKNLLFVGTPSAPAPSWSAKSPPCWARSTPPA